MENTDCKFVTDAIFNEDQSATTKKTFVNSEVSVIKFGRLDVMLISGGFVTDEDSFGDTFLVD